MSYSDDTAEFMFTGQPTRGELRKDQSVEDYLFPLTQHIHAWGPLERSRLAGTVHRKCKCGEVLAFESEEDYPLNLEPGVPQPIQEDQDK